MHGRCWRTFAFGLEVNGDFQAPGLDASPASGTGAPGTRVAVVGIDQLMARWPRSAARVLYELRADELSVPVLVISRAEEAGYLLQHQMFGTYLVGPDGSHVAAAPAPLAAWRWQRFVIGQVLPLAAVLQGLEVFHASAVAIGDCAVLFMGPSGSGKTTLALGLMMAGAGFLADDVVALSGGAQAVMAHPGAAVASLDGQMAGSMQAAWGREPGVALGAEGDERRLVVRRDGVSCPVRLVYLLQPRAGGGATSIAGLDGPDPRRLLGSTFNAYVDAPERLLRQLGTCAALSRSARFFALETADTEIERVIGDVKSHAESVLALAPS